MNRYIDKQAILERIDLLTLIGGDLKRKASTNGGEYTGPCPFCGGSDRFNVQPYRRPFGLWMCRNCTGGKWQNAIDFVIKRDNLDFKTACAALAGGDLPTTREVTPPPPKPAEQPTGGDWQAQAMQAIAQCYANLRRPIGSAALAWLHGRGLKDKTIDYFRLGFSPGAKFGDMWIPRGVVIPCVVLDEVWYLKIALLDGDPVKCGKCEKPTKARQPCPHCDEVNKYTGVAGNRVKAIFNGDELLEHAPVLFCEGEIDCMIAHQVLGAYVAVAGMSGAKTGLDLAAWGAHLVSVQHAMILFDNDPAGAAGALKMLDLLGDRAIQCKLPDGVKDVNDFYLAGGDLYGWLLPYLERLGLLEADRV